MLVVLDTNILVSALWSKDGKPWKILNLISSEEIKPCFDFRIMAEYKAVLLRPHFKFSSAEVSALLSVIETSGISVFPVPAKINFTDQTDKKFYEVAKHCDAKLITGNIRHFPEDPDIMTPANFLHQIMN